MRNAPQVDKRGCGGIAHAAAPLSLWRPGLYRAPPFPLLQRQGKGWKVSGSGVAARCLLARILGLYFALVEESNGLLVKLVFGTGVLTALEAIVLVVSGLLHHHQATRCGSPVGYRSATPQQASGNTRENRVLRGFGLYITSGLRFPPPKVGRRGLPFREATWVCFQTIV
jgi:hypothetical protein